jgi:intergrase/recombinase
MTSTVLLKRGKKKKNGVAVYVPKDSNLKEMAAKIKSVMPAFYFLPSPGTFP